MRMWFLYRPVAEKSAPGEMLMRSVKAARCSLRASILGDSSIHNM